MAEYAAPSPVHSKRKHTKKQVADEEDVVVVEMEDIPYEKK
jgi:hypothetical protein